MNWYPLLAVLPFILAPALIALVDAVPSVRARRTAALAVEPTSTHDDFEVLVPIWGDVTYLENEEFLADYPDKVILATTTSESREFDRALEDLAARRRFRIVRADVPRTPTTRGGRRTVSGTVRDRVARTAARAVTAKYVVCLDADTVPERPLGQLVGAMERHGLDVASVRILPSNTGSVLGGLQHIEYRLSMNLRRLWPWLVSGACHAATAEAYRRILDRHSLFFQGNDAEVGILAKVLGHKVGHVAYDVPTTVPSTPLRWWRQRFAWSGGEFRLSIVNLPVILRRFPLFSAYTAVMVLLLAPVRWANLIELPLALGVAYGAYLALVVASERKVTPLAFLYPLYGLVGSMVLAVLSPISYVGMAANDRNAGLIRATPKEGRSPALRKMAAVVAR